MASIESLPECIGDLPNLKAMECQSCAKLTSFPVKVLSSSKFKWFLGYYSAINSNGFNLITHPRFSKEIGENNLFAYFSI